MILLAWHEPKSVEDVQQLVQGAIDLEFSTLPPYLYAKFSILPDTNAASLSRFDSIVGEEMIHMCLACNILNAIGGTVRINPPSYPGTLPGGVASGLVINLYPFSPDAVAQGMAIEAPSNPITPNLMKSAADSSVTIGEYYMRLDAALAALPNSAWTAGRNQIDDAQFFAGALFAVNGYADAHRAIHDIVSEGEGTPVTPDDSGSPLDFENELAHYYRFWEIQKNQLLQKDVVAGGYRWGAPLGVNWAQVYPAIVNPQTADFSKASPSAQAAQLQCNLAFSHMVDALTQAFSGDAAGLGLAVRAMFDLRMAAIRALNTPLDGNGIVSGPAFVYLNAAQRANAVEGHAA